MCCVHVINEQLLNVNLITKNGRNSSDALLWHQNGSSSEDCLLKTLQKHKENVMSFSLWEFMIAAAAAA